MPLFFQSKCPGFATRANAIRLVYRQIRFSKTSQMPRRNSRQPHSCEKRSSETPILPCAKIRIFRKCRKLFAEKSHLRRMNEWPKMAKNAKAHKMRHLAKTHFSQMFWGCISKPMNNRLSWWDDYRLTAANVRRSIRPVFPMRPCNSRCKDTNKRAKNKINPHLFFLSSASIFEL